MKDTLKTTASVEKEIRARSGVSWNPNPRTSAGISRYLRWARRSRRKDKGGRSTFHGCHAEVSAVAREAGVPEEEGGNFRVEGSCGGPVRRAAGSGSLGCGGAGGGRGAGWDAQLFVQLLLRGHGMVCVGRGHKDRLYPDPAVGGDASHQLICPGLHPA